MPFVHASADDKNGNSLPDGGKGFGWPRYVDFRFQQKYVIVILCGMDHMYLYIYIYRHYVSYLEIQDTSSLV